MAIRYSGDVTVTMTWDPRRRELIGDVKDGRRTLSMSAPGQEPPPNRPATRKQLIIFYDRAAAGFFRRARRAGFLVPNRWGRVRLRRGYQAPCPR